MHQCQIIDTDIDPIPIHTGVFQGQSSAVTIFLIALAPLLLALEKAENLRPLSSTYIIPAKPDQTTTLTIRPVIAFSDDINILGRIKVDRHGNSKELDEISNILERFKSISGIALAPEKTLIYSYKNTRNINLLTLNRKCKTKQKIKVLGHTFDPHKTETSDHHRLEQETQNQINLLNFTKNRVANNFIFCTYI